MCYLCCERPTSAMQGQRQRPWAPCGLSVPKHGRFTSKRLTTLPCPLAPVRGCTGFRCTPEATPEADHLAMSVPWSQDGNSFSGQPSASWGQAWQLLHHLSIAQGNLSATLPLEWGQQGAFPRLVNLYFYQASNLTGSPRSGLHRISPAAWAAWLHVAGQRPSLLQLGMRSWRGLPVGPKILSEDGGLD